MNSADRELINLFLDDLPDRQEQFLLKENSFNSFLKETHSKMKRTPEIIISEIPSIGITNASLSLRISSDTRVFNRSFSHIHSRIDARSKNIPIFASV